MWVSNVTASWNVSVRTRLGTVKYFPPAPPEPLQNQPNLMGNEVSLNKILCAFFFKFTPTQLSPSQITAFDLSRKGTVAKFDILTAMSTFPLFLDMIQFLLVYAYHCFGRICCSYLQGSPIRLGIPPGLIGIGYPHDKIFGLTWKRK